MQIVKNIVKVKNREVRVMKFNIMYLLYIKYEKQIRKTSYMYIKMGEEKLKIY